MTKQISPDYVTKYSTIIKQIIIISAGKEKNAYYTWNVKPTQMWISV